ncbi:MAG: M48 family metalloprotease [Kiloniellales bacterium]|nr:M48 family metalloprotease [Kiloniellales bacterium]
MAPAVVEAKGLRFIRDTEIENTVRAYSTPIFLAAGLNPQAVDVYLIDDPRLNAFVAGGQNMFLHTGLLLRAETPLQVMGVIAHETGHITGGHIVTRGDEVQKTTAALIASYVLGIGTAIATGRGDAGAAIISGGQGAAVASLLAYTRGQEASADQAAIKLLESSGYSPRGLLEFFEILGDQEALLSSRQDPYLRTHPLTQDRIASLRAAVQESRFADEPAPPELVAMHERMRAKLLGYLTPIKALRRFSDNDDSLPARYARSIAYLERGQMPEALAEADSLIEDYPGDPYFHELKGDIFFHSGRLADARPEYQKAVQILPDAPLIRRALAHVQIELNQPNLNKEALGHLQYVTQREPRNVTGWRLLASVQGRMGDQGMSTLSKAEAALAMNNPREAKGFAQRALKLLPEYSPGWLRAQDIDGLADRLRKRS